MKAQLKAEVLAKCQELAPNFGNEFCLPSGAIVFRAYPSYTIVSAGAGKTIIDLSDDLPPESWEWVTAAQILGVEKTEARL